MNKSNETSFSIICCSGIGPLQFQWVHCSVNWLLLMMRSTAQPNWLYVFFNLIWKYWLLSLFYSFICKRCKIYYFYIFFLWALVSVLLQWRDIVTIPTLIKKEFYWGLLNFRSFAYFHHSMKEHAMQGNIVLENQ